VTELLRARWLGRVPYREALSLQRALHAGARDARGSGGVPRDDYLLLLEHPHVYTLGRQADTAHLLVRPADVGADLEPADRGGDVTYHGPGQLVGYPIVTLPEWRDGLRDVVQYVRRLEAVLIAALADLGIEAGVEKGLTGVWAPTPSGAVEKIAAIGVKVTRGRTMHGFALNVDPDLAMFGHIVPCGIRDRTVTSMTRILGRPVDMRTVVDTVVARFAEDFAPGAEVERQDVVWQERPSDLSAFTLHASANPGEAVQLRRSGSGGTPVRLIRRREEAGVTDQVDGRRPEWMKVRARLGGEYRELKNLMRGLELHTVCGRPAAPTSTSAGPTAPPRS
jgi:lipoic acid synthetase